MRAAYCPAEAEVQGWLPGSRVPARIIAIARQRASQPDTGPVDRGNGYLHTRQPWPATTVEANSSPELRPRAFGFILLAQVQGGTPSDTPLA